MVSPILLSTILCSTEPAAVAYAAEVEASKPAAMNNDLASLLTDPTNVIRDFREDVLSILAWIEHWEEDRRHNLMPTEGSMAAAKTKAQAILRRLG